MLDRSTRRVCCVLLNTAIKQGLLFPSRGGDEAGLSPALFF